MQTTSISTMLGAKEAFEVGVAESTEKWSEFTFDDGTKMKAKIMVAGAARIKDEYDEDGNPVYALQAAPVFVLVSAPDKLKDPKKKA